MRVLAVNFSRAAVYWNCGCGDGRRDCEVSALRCVKFVEVLDAVCHRYECCLMCIAELDGGRRTSVHDVWCVFVKQNHGALSLT